MTAAHEPLLLALDVGTTALKAVLFDAAGRTVASAAEEYRLQTPEPNVVELNPEIYWEATRKTIADAFSRSAAAPEAVGAIGVTSQGETLVALDAAGKPLRPAIVWLDNRTQGEAAQVGEAFSVADVYRVTGQQELIPTWTATRILWLRNHEPTIFERARKFLLVEDYLIYRLTGEFVTDHALNPSTLYYDIEARDWWNPMLAFLGINRTQLPRLANSGETAGRLTPAAAAAVGLRAGTPVTTAPIDQIAGAVGAGNLQAGAVSETTGAALAICATGERPVYDPRRRLGLYLHAVPGRYALLPWAPTAGMVLRWFRDTFGGGASYDELDREAEAIAPGADGLTMLPHLGGAGCPDVNPAAKGAFWGITLSHGRGHFTRAILEAVAFMLRGNLELLAELGVETREVRSLGGAARSPLWLRIKADVCGRDLLVMECEEATCLGTAMIAAVAGGVHRDLETARAAMVRIKGRVAYDPSATGQYEAAYQQYRKVHESVRSLI
jgi:xylulokinase